MVLFGLLKLCWRTFINLENICDIFIGEKKQAIRESDPTFTSTHMYVWVENAVCYKDNLILGVAKWNDFYFIYIYLFVIIFTVNYIICILI